MILSPSILNCDYSNLTGELQKAYESGAEFIHLDVMDGVFVPSKGLIQEEMVARVNGQFPLVNDVHLMVVHPLKRVKAFAEAGANIITFHVEAYHRPSMIKKTIELIHSCGCRAGISLKPGTRVEALVPYLPLVDLVLVMSVEPGAGGQSFMEEALPRISFLANRKKEHGYHYLIEVDGGIVYETGKKCAEAGVEVIVSGSYLYHSDDFKGRAEGLIAL